MKEAVYRPIGFVENDFQNPDDPKRIRNSNSVLVLNEKCIPAMEGLEKFRYLIVIYHMDKAPGYREKVHPMGDKSIPMRGVLSTRSPCRPSPLGITVVEVLEVKKNRITVTGLDALDGSPLPDIKPYEEHFDSPMGLKWERDSNYRPRDIPYKEAL